MKTLKIDLNELDDNELEMYLALKKKNKQQKTHIQKVTEEKPKKRKYKRRRKRRSAKGWKKSLKDIEEYLIKKPRIASDIFKKVGIKHKGGMAYKTIKKYLNEVYGSRLIKIKAGRRTYYQVKNKERPNKSKSKKRSMVFWTDNMVKDLVQKKSLGMSAIQIADDINRKYGLELSGHQINVKYSNWKKKNKKQKKENTKEENIQNLFY